MRFCLAKCRMVCRSRALTWAASACLPLRLKAPFRRPWCIYQIDKAAWIVINAQTQQHSVSFENCVHIQHISVTAHEKAGKQHEPHHGVMTRAIDSTYEKLVRTL